MDLCCIRGCTNVNKDENIVYFEFPLSRTLRRKWLEVINIGSKVPMGTLICSQHFDVNDYETVRGKVRLKKKVVPSILVNDLEDKSPEKIVEQPENTDELYEKEIREDPKDDSLDKDDGKSPNPNDETESIEERDTRRQEKNETKSETVTGKKESDSQNKESQDYMSSDERDADVRNEEEDIGSNREEEIGVSEEKKRDLPTLKEKTPELTDVKQPADFEEMITNYHIKISKPDVLRSEDMEIEVPALCERENTIVVDDIGDSAPVFIEIPTDKDSNPKNTNNQDCLMVLESVQVDVDPTSLMLPERELAEDNEDSDSDVEINMPDKKADPISLVTSSDEDDVIIQEPKIDTVEVSDETDEDDMPLVKLVKKKPLKKRSIRQPNKLDPIDGQDLKNVIWSGNYYYCCHCNFSTTDRVVYTSHIEEHGQALHICTVCSYTTSSKNQYWRHLRKHKEERKYNCHLCSYRARHNMSLIYHLQSHNSDECDKKGYKSVKKGYKCVKCNYRSDYKGDVVKHLKVCDSDKKHKCNLCNYSTKRKSDMKRHWTSRHSDVVEVDSDDSYKPPGWD